MRIGTVITKVPGSTTWRWITTISFQRIVFYGWSFANFYDINTLRRSSIYATFCRLTKCIFCMRMCLTSTTVISGLAKIIMVRDNVDIKSTLAFTFDWIGWVEIVLPRLFEDMSLTVGHDLCFHHYRSPACYGEYVLQLRTWLTQECGLVVKGTLPGLLGRWS